MCAAFCRCALPSFLFLSLVVERLVIAQRVERAKDFRTQSTLILHVDGLVNVANVDAKAARLAKDFVTVAAGQAVHGRSGVRQLMVAIIVLGTYKKKFGHLIRSQYYRSLVKGKKGSPLCCYDGICYPNNYRWVSNKDNLVHSYFIPFFLTVWQFFLHAFVDSKEKSFIFFAYLTFNMAKFLVPDAAAAASGATTTTPFSMIDALVVAKAAHTFVGPPALGTGKSLRWNRGPRKLSTRLSEFLIFADRVAMFRRTVEVEAGLGSIKTTT